MPDVTVVCMDGLVAPTLHELRVRSGRAGARLMAEVSITTLLLLALLYVLMVDAQRLP